MSIAFQALVLFAIALPGIVLRKRMSTAGPFRQPRSLTDELAQSLIYAAIAHTVWVWLCGLFVPYTRVVSLKSVVMLAIGQFGPNQFELPRAMNALTESAPWVAAYFLTLTVAAGVAGSTIRALSRKSNWLRSILNWIEDEEPGAARATEWKVFLKQHSGKPLEDGVILLLTTVVELGKTAYLYAGVLQETMFRANGDPEGFFLSDARRRPLTDADGNEPEPGLGRFHPIAGDRFFIRLSEAKTLNIVGCLIEAEEIHDAPPSGEDRLASDSPRSAVQGTAVEATLMPPTTPHTES